MRTISLFTLGAAALVATTEVRADPADHEGFMARLGIGAGFMSSSETAGSTTLSISGAEGSVQLALGGYVIPNFAIHATLWGGTALSPSVSITSGSSTLGGTATNASLLASAFGVGATYFLTPIDLYFSGSIGAGVLRFSSTRGAVTYDARTEIGVALNLVVGKQWAVSRAWGLGVSGQFGWQSNPDGDSSLSTTASISTIQAALLFSVTYH